VRGAGTLSIDVWVKWLEVRTSMVDVFVHQISPQGSRDALKFTRLLFMAMALGYTRTGHEVLLPSRHSPSVEAFRHWTRGDHVDAERILKEHGEREVDPKISSWCRHWAKAHRGLRKLSSKTVSIRGAAEISIKTRGRVKR
jgi:hypothetical protein